MKRRILSLVLLTVLIAGTFVAAFFLNDIDRHSDDLLATRNDIDTRLARLSDTLSAIGAAQQSYVAPGQAAQPWLERMSGLVGQLYDDTTALKPLLPSAETLAALQAFADSTEALVSADARARENLQLGQPLMAADVIFSDSRNTLDSMAGDVRALRDAEHSAHAAAFAGLKAEARLVLGITALGWIVGVILLMAIPRGRSEPAGSISILESPVSAAPTPQVIRQPSVDLAAAAEICTALSRVSSTAALPDLLGRAAVLLDAPGIILWMGAGEQLFAVTAHGYQPQVIARLGPIARTGDNATAEAWRTGKITTVPGKGEARGAIVAPMFGPDTTIGVLAIEVRHGREKDAAARAVAAMIAAQLATAVSAWPAPSETSIDVAPQFRKAGA